jgi:hypothetical protein
VTWHPTPQLLHYSWQELSAANKTKSANGSLVLYGSMIADDLVIHSRVATLIRALDATLVALSSRISHTSQQRT